MSKKEQLVKTPTGNWILLSNYLGGGAVFKTFQSDTLWKVRLHNTDANKASYILVSDVSEEDGQAILDEWIDKVEKFKLSQKVEQPVQLPNGNFVLLSLYGEIWIDANCVCIGLRSGEGYRKLATFDTMEEGIKLRDEWAYKIMEAMT